MRRSRRICTLVAVPFAMAAILGLARPVVAAAPGTAGCSGSWALSQVNQQASCTFTAQYALADTTESSYGANAEISTGMSWTAVGPVLVAGAQAARLQLVDGSGDVLATCFVAANGLCSSGVWSTSPPVPAGTVLTCVVEGRGSGSFDCNTY